MIQIPLTPEQFASRKADVAKQLGTSLGDSGTISHDGVTVDYRYDGTSMLVLNIKHKPTFVPSSVVESKIREWFATA